jgi:hypothetical protein
MGYRFVSGKSIPEDLQKSDILYAPNEEETCKVVGEAKKPKTA